MQTKTPGESPLEIPNLKALQDALDGEPDSQKLLGAFNGNLSRISDGLTAITDEWLTAAREEENAA